MTITILSNGFVKLSSVDPVAYAGEMNSRFIDIIHPTFENAIYQLIIIKEKRPYILGIDGGRIMLPPSMTDIATNLECQFVASRKNSNNISNCNCGPQYSNDCSTMVFKSDTFTLKIAEGLNLNGLTPIPTYEVVSDMYNNLTQAKYIVEQSKAENQDLAEAIEHKLDELKTGQSSLNLKIVDDSNGNVIFSTTTKTETTKYEPKSTGLELVDDTDGNVVFKTSDD